MASNLRAERLKIHQLAGLIRQNPEVFVSFDPFFLWSHSVPLISVICTSSSSTFYAITKVSACLRLRRLCPRLLEYFFTSFPLSFSLCLALYSTALHSNIGMSLCRSKARPFMKNCHDYGL